ncbi:exonuclease, DNA polymerase III, epsilon subunit family [Siphonobacter aquaeclarae]|jgi:DNA polymerase-3 subunit epsilon|uniref:Exonuclease, DNA polymerase III, epsilon subunit family n=2 Tax=Siphonobacter aquaeclarae TaxID=563176 RepID=A0A1G9RQP3_9BACT|nr:exonuclease, DNA polymerase III, epsilon subunit family [Siphonobacter aquaeclarae]
MEMNQEGPRHRRLYAIVDIETTGGIVTDSGITEVAIRLHNGLEIVDRYETLVNPERPIPPFIQGLTGINDEMVRDSPTFADVAAEIHRYLEGNIFVAHNVGFDYSFLKYHLSLAGIEFSAPRLCTVKLSRKIKPGHKSYSLGKLCNDLNITLNNRHRAAGDAEATAILFTRLLEWDSKGYTASQLRLPRSMQQPTENGQMVLFQA